MTDNGRLQRTETRTGLHGPGAHLSGRAIRTLMRAHGKTIAGIAREFDITQKRVRFVREHGVTGAAFVRDWLEILSYPKRPPYESGSIWTGGYSPARGFVSTGQRAFVSGVVLSQWSKPVAQPPRQGLNPGA